VGKEIERPRSLSSPWRKKKTLSRKSLDSSSRNGCGVCKRKGLVRKKKGYPDGGCSGEQTFTFEARYEKNHDEAECGPGAPKRRKTLPPASRGASKKERGGLRAAKKVLSGRRESCLAAESHPPGFLAIDPKRVGSHITREIKVSSLIFITREAFVY